MNKPLSFSRLSRLEVSYNYFLEPYDDKLTEAKVIGTALHLALFEPEKYAEMKESKFLGVTGKQFAEEYKEAKGLILPQGKKEIIDKALKNLINNPAVLQILSQKDRRTEEKVNGTIRGYDFTGRVDFMAGSIIADLKIIGQYYKNAHLLNWGMRDKFVASQLALYRALCLQQFKGEQENYDCYAIIFAWDIMDSIVVKFSEKTLQGGEAKINEWIDKLIGVELNDDYKGISGEIIEL